MKVFIIVLFCGLSVQGLFAIPTESETESSVNHVDASVATPSVNQVCVPNDVKMEECNRCKCAPNGVGWFCTRKACVSDTQVVDETHEHTVERRSTQECEPGTTFKRDCNTCQCTSTGLAACTKKKCVHLPPPESSHVQKRSVEGEEEGQKDCEPGTKWKEDCNSCFCTSNGQKACTLMMCFSLDKIEDLKVLKEESVQRNTLTKRSVSGEPDVYSDSFHCVPNKSFKHPDGCNQCSCDEYGKTRFCTKVACPVRPKRSVDVYADSYHCEPNKQFDHPDGCNKCHCNEHGKTKYCTKLFCGTRNKRSPISSKGKCTPGESFVAEDGCNTCFCKADGTPGGCTFKLCVDQPRQIRSVENNNNPGAPNFSCVPGTHFKHADKCNDCTCSANGKFAACTLKLCVDAPRRDPYADNYHCTPGTTFINPADGCNTCTCNDQGKTSGCTEKACLEDHHKTKRSPVMNDPASPDFSCVPGSTFTHADGCNQCTCADNGQNAACTLKLCEGAPVEVVSVQQVPQVYSGSPYEPGFSCVPEASFKYDCNDCRCLANGKAAMCTAKLCLSSNARMVRGISNNNNPNDPNFRCTPGEPFTHSDGCNSCICAESGTTAACTLKLCLPSQVEATTIVPNTIAIVPPHEKKCVPGSRFMSDDGCNTCFCTNEGKVGCTLMYCGNKAMSPLSGGLPPNSNGNQRPVQFPIDKRHKRQTDIMSLPHFDTSVEGFKCQPGLRFRDKCNACQCNNEGLPACTDQLCPDH